jgi:integrase/recombinase XerC
MAGHSELTEKPLSAAADAQAVFALWLDYLKNEKRFSPHTLRAYLADLHVFFDFFTRHQGKPPAMQDLGDLKIGDFRSWLSRITADGASAATRARMLASLRSFFKWMDKNGHLHNAAIGRIRTPKQAKRLPRALPPDQARRVIEEADVQAREDWIGLRDRALFCLLYGCGLRIDEALQLNFGNRPQNGDLRVMGKGRKERYVPVIPIVEKLLAEYIAVAPVAFEKQTPLFIGTRGGRLHQGVAQRQMRHLRRALGLPETLTPHALRHSFATHILANGANLRAIQELLGHASVTTTQRYTDFDNAQLLAIYDKSHPRAK